MSGNRERLKKRSKLNPSSVEARQDEVTPSRSGLVDCNIGKSKEHGHKHDSQINDSGGFSAGVEVLEGSYELGPRDAALICAVKTLLNLNLKFMYPFQPFLAEHMGLTWAKIAILVMMPELMSTLAAIVGPMLQRCSPRKLSFWCMTAIGISTLLVPFAPNFTCLIILRGIFGLFINFANACFSTAIGQNTPEEHRGAYITFTECAWTLSDYLMPLVGYIMFFRIGRSMIWVGIGVLSVLMGIVMVFRLPEHPKRRKIEDTGETDPLLGGSEVAEAAKREDTLPRASTDQQSTNRDESLCGIFINYLYALEEVFTEPRVAVMLIFSLFSTVPYTIVLSTFGWWLKEDWDCNSIQVGKAMLSLSIGETFGFIFTALFSDRIGLHRCAYYGAVAVEIITIIWTSTLLYNGFYTNMIIMCALISAGEVTYISIISYATVVMPDHGFAVVSALFGVLGIGRMVACIVAPPLYRTQLEWFKIGIRRGFFIVLIFQSVIWGTSVAVLAQILCCGPMKDERKDEGEYLTV